MKKRWLLNFALILFVIALGLVVKYQPGTSKKSTETAALTNLAIDNIAHIRIVRSGQDEIVLTKTNGHWQMTAPIQARADDFRIDGLLHIANAKIEGKFTAAAADLAKYGLDHPLADLWLDNNEIKFGGLHTFANSQYVLFNGEIYLIPAAGFRPLASSLNDFFSTRLLEEGRKPIAFKLPNFSLTLENGNWSITPQAKNLSNDKINTFVEEWRYARALSVQRYTGKKAIGAIRITFLEIGKTNATPKPQTLDLAILAQQSELVLYRKDEGLEYHFPQEISEHLLSLAAE